MATIAAADVKKLRDATSAGMMECKKALEESGGDFDKAVEILRISGAAKAAKRGAERTASNGIVAASGNTSITGAYGTLLLAADGTYTYNVNNTNPTVEALRIFFYYMSYTLIYTVKDTAGLTSTATLTVTIHGANDAVTASAWIWPWRISSGRRSSGTSRRSKSCKGELSSSERGLMRRHLAKSQPADNSVIHLAPERSMLRWSARYTSSAWKWRQVVAIMRTVASKSSLPQARAEALIAPAEVPVMMGKGLGPCASPQAWRRSAMASSTPTW
mgnify:CR=1 FL=1